MFKRLLLEDSAAIFTLVAFLTASSIFIAIVWRALHMKRAQLDHFAQLPLQDETRPAASRHEA